MTEKVTITTSQRFSLNPQDIAKWIKNQKIFLIPLAMIYLAFVIAKVGEGGFALTDFIPSNEVITAMVLYVLNAVYDLLRKWVQVKEYIEPIAPKGV